MSLKDAFAISWQNDLAAFTLSSDVAAEDSYPLTNAQNEISDEPAVFDMSGDDGLSITFSSATQRSGSCFGVHNHNAPVDNGVRLRLYQAEDSAGKLLKDTGSAVATLDGSTQYFTVPDTAGNSVDGSILALYARVNPDDPTPAGVQATIAKWTTSGNQRSWALNLMTDGNIRALVSSDGASSESVTFSTAPSWDDKSISIKVLMNLVSGDCELYQYMDTDSAIDGADFDYLDDENLWVEIDTGSINPTSIFDSTSPVFGGTYGAGAGWLWDGEFVRAAAYVDGAIIADIDTRRYVTGTTMTSETGDTVTIAGDPTIAITYPLLAHTIEFGVAIAGIDPLAGFYESTSKLKTHYSTWFDTVVYRSGRIDWDAPTSTDDQLASDKLWLGFAWQPDHGPEWGYGSPIVDTNTYMDKPGGGVHTIPNAQYRRLRIRFELVEDLQRNTLVHVLERSKDGRDVMITMDPNNVLKQRRGTSSIYKCVSGVSPVANSFNNNALGAEFREN